jgi:Tol biopolymer transport system component
VFRSERNGGGIYIVDTAGGKERLLAPNGQNPRFSPDGRSVAYWIGDYDRTMASGKIFVMSLTDGSSVHLAADFRDARSPVWNSDGRHILFTGCRAGVQPMSACSEWWVTTRDARDANDTGALALLRARHLEPIEEIGGWYGDTVLFNGAQGPAWSLWELTIPRSTLRAEGNPRQLTSGEAREVAPSLAENRTIAFEHVTAALHIWRIDPTSGPQQFVATKVTGGAPDRSPNISLNGRWLAFTRTGHEIWIKDMRSGAEALFLSSATKKLSPIIDDSGTTVAFEGREGELPSLFTVTRGQPARSLPVACENPTGWFDGTRAVFCREGQPSRIEMVDLANGAAITVLETKGYSLSEAAWSPANQYLLFTASREGATKQVFAVHFPTAAPVPSQEWIPVTGKSEFSDRPRWSGNGRTIFYLSRRDGFSCVWGQRFDPVSGRVMGTPFPVLHYHNPRFSPHVVEDRFFNLSVARDSIYLNVGEINTSVWVGQLKRRSLVSLLWPSR